MTSSCVLICVQVPGGKIWQQEGDGVSVPRGPSQKGVHRHSNRPRARHCGTLGVRLRQHFSITLRRRGEGI